MSSNRVEDSFILCVLLFGACLNFMGRGPVIFLCFCLWGILKTSNYKIRWNVSSICYLLMSLSSILASMLFFDAKEVIKSFIYFLVFIVGYKGFLASYDKELFIRRIIFSAFLGFEVNLLITYYSNFILIGHISGQRELYSFWTHDLMSVTLAGLMSSVPIAYSFYCFFCGYGWLYKILGIISVAVVFLINIGTATRTPFVLMGVVYISLLYEFFSCHNIKHKGKKFSLLLVACSVLVYTAIPKIANSAIAERFNDEGINTSRGDITITYIGEMLNYPLGGSEIAKHTNLLAHNFILEAYDMYGMLFFIPMIVLFILIMQRIIRLHKLKNKGDVSFLLFAMYLAMFIQIMLEPVIGGYPQLPWLLFLVDGITIPYLEGTHIKSGNFICHPNYKRAEN